MSQQPEKTREDSFREARKQIVRSAFLALAALGVIVFACYAWFVSSGTVTGKISSVLMNGTTFELASVGDSGGALDNLIPDHDELGPETWTSDGVDYKTTTSNKNAVLWQLTTNSHLNNLSQDTGIQPGNSGTLEFYVIPKCSGDLKLKCKISLQPVQINDNSVTNLPDSPADMFLQGHILFAFTYHYTDEYPKEEYEAKNHTGISLINYKSGEFILNLEGALENKPILVTLDWIWPLLLKNIIDEPLWDSEEISNTVKGWMSSERYHFFYNDGEEFDNPSFSDPNDKRKYNSYYNNADEYIGTHVDGIIVKLTAEEN